MNILFLAHRIPYPPNKGEKIRAFHELQFLAARHTIDLFCFADNAAEAEEQWNLRNLCRRIYVEARNPAWIKLRMARSFARQEPLTNGCFFSPRFRNEVRGALARERYDLIFVYCSSMAQYVPRPSPAPVVVDFVDVDSAKWAQYARFSRAPLSWVYAREARLLGQFEEAVAESSSLSIVATTQEAAQLLRGHRFSVEVIENGVVPLPTSLGTQLPDELRQLQPYLLFIGQMDYRPNIDAVTYFAKDVLPRVRQAYPGVRFLIAGRNPTRSVRRLAVQEGVVVCGGIADVQPYLLGASVVVAPFRISQGIQNKILEALASRRPVVSTRRPAEAIGAKHGETLLIADSAEDFTQSIVGLLRDPELHRKFDSGPEFVRKNFDWQSSLKRLERLLEDVAGDGRRRSQGEPVGVEAKRFSE
jgi:polysaccharide biosynthesis protein PslH